MKIRESGMPEDSLWSSFFDPEQILMALDVNTNIELLADFGCGYGTFTIPAAKLIKGRISAFDLDIDFVKEAAEFDNIKNIDFICRDFISNGSGLNDESVDYVMLFNILHFENPQLIFKEVFRILKKNGKVGIIHWRTDIETPRGPSMEIRPSPEFLINTSTESGFVMEKNILLEPYHYGILLKKS